MAAPATLAPGSGEVEARADGAPAAPGIAFGPELGWVPAAVPLPDEPEGYPSLYRRFGLSLGGAFYGNFNTSARVSSAVLIGAVLDLEDFLGVDSSSGVFRLDMHYAFNRRHRLDAAYYDIRRSGTRTVGEDLEIGDVIIPAGPVTSSFDTRIFKLDYRYNFVADERTVIATSIGLHTMAIDTAFESTTFDVAEQFDVVAPLPLVGLHGAYALDHKWTLSGGFEALRVKIGNFDGFILDTRLSLDHDTFEHFGWGIGFNSFDMNLKVDQALSAEIEYGYSGLLLYLRTYF